MFLSRSIAILGLAWACTAPQPESAGISARIPVLIIDGVNNHGWARTTAAVKATIERTGRFAVEVSTSPNRRATREEWEAWRPAFSDYAVVVSNFNSDCEREDGGCEPYWSADARADFEAFVREGGGFVSVHAADNHAADWVGYNEMIAVGGWGGRRAGVSGSILAQDRRRLGRDLTRRGAEAGGTVASGSSKSSTTSPTTPFWPACRPSGCTRRTSSTPRSAVRPQTSRSWRTQLPGHG